MSGEAKLERVAKLMATRGLCSRREADRLIEAGQVRVDGEVVRELGSKASPRAAIEILSDGTAELARRITVVLHKPVGIVSTQPEPGQTPAWQLLVADGVEGEVDRETLARVLARPWELSVAGRLDRLSRGLLLLTDDGVVARRIVGGRGVKKHYRVRTAEPVSDTQIERLCGEMKLDGRRLLPMHVERLASHRLRFVLVEGKKHQIRRVCRQVGLTVVDLLRDAIGPLRLGDLPPGHWRLATRAELEKLAAGT